MPLEKIVEEASGSVTTCDGQWMSRAPSPKLPFVKILWEVKVVFRITPVCEMVICSPWPGSK